MPAVAYGLYLLTYAVGVTVFIGLIIAYMNRDRAGSRMRTHYTFLIRTFWLSIAWWLIGGAVLAAGFVLSVVLIGLPLLVIGGFILAVVGIWFALRCIMGVVYLARDEPYPRPYTWLA